jgi:hypothetical protein
LNHVGAADLSDLARNAFRVRQGAGSGGENPGPVLRGAGLIKNSSQQSLILLISVSFHLPCEILDSQSPGIPRNSLGNAFGVRLLTPAPVVRILRPVLRGAGLIKSSSQQSLILLIYSSFHLSCEI